MIIGTCGFCSTGSSAVSDYLKEFDENQVLDEFEFTIPYLPDGLEDLEYHLTKQFSRVDSSMCAIERFRRYMDKYCVHGGMTKLSSLSAQDAKAITDDFLESIVQLKWKDICRSDILLYPSNLYRYFGLSIMAQRIRPFLNKKFKRPVDIYPVRELEVSIAPSNFDEASKKFLRNLLTGMGADYSKNIVLDQPFSGDDPIKSFKYFDDPVAIVVDRDPRDNYLFARKCLFKAGRLMPTDTVKEFVQYYKLVRDNRPYKKSDSRILRLHFEDLVYNYAATSKVINEFCHLPDNPHPFTIFKPNMSMANTQLFLRYPEYKEDITYIEKELPEYLFNFGDYPPPVQTGSMFFGKSPLNRK